MKTFAERLRYYRKKAGYHQKELAEKLDMTRQNYANYETKKQMPNIETLIKLANVLGTDVNTLVGYQENEKEKMLVALRSAGIQYETDPENADKLKIIFKENLVELRLTFSELKGMLAFTENQM